MQGVKLIQFNVAYEYITNCNTYLQLQYHLPEVP